MSTTPGSHLTDFDIDQLVHGRLSKAEARKRLQHLARCPHCRAQERPWLSPLAVVLVEGREAPRPLPETGYDEALDRALAKIPVLQARVREEEAWRKRLLAVACGCDTFRIETSEPRWLFPGIDLETVPGRPYAEALLTLSAGERFRETEAMEHLAVTADMVARQLGFREVDRGHYSSVEVADLQARTAAELANAYRRNARFDSAEQAIEEGLQTLRFRGSRDLLIEARLLDILASLRLDQRRTGRAFVLLEGVARRYQQVGESHLSGRALISKGIATAFDGRPWDAAPLFREALTRIDPARDPKLVVNAQYELLHCVVDAEQYHEASAYLLRSGLGQAFADDPLNLLRLRGLEGRMFAGLGQLRRAEGIFCDLKKQLRSADRHYLVGMACLELAAVYLRQREPQAAEAQAAEALATFDRLGVSYEAEKAVAALREACRIQRATAEMALRVIFFLQRLERDPALLLPQ